VEPWLTCADTYLMKLNRTQLKQDRAAGLAKYEINFLDSLVKGTFDSNKGALVGEMDDFLFHACDPTAKSSKHGNILALHPLQMEQQNKQKVLKCCFECHSHGKIRASLQNCGARTTGKWKCKRVPPFSSSCCLQIDD
jgi:hypothetical protein